MKGLDTVEKLSTGVGWGNVLKKYYYVLVHGFILFTGGIIVLEIRAQSTPGALVGMRRWGLVLTKIWQQP